MNCLASCEIRCLVLSHDSGPTDFSGSQYTDSQRWSKVSKHSCNRSLYKRPRWKHDLRIDREEAAYVTSPLSSSQNWILDFGASRHTSGNVEVFSLLVAKTVLIAIAGGLNLLIEGVRTLQIFSCKQSSSDSRESSSESWVLCEAFK